MPSLTDLSTELLAQIVDLVHATSPSSTPALSQTCSRLRRLAQRSQHQTVVLRSRADAQLRRIAHDLLLPAIRRLELTSTTTATLLPSLLPAMTGLVDLVVARHHRVPRALLDALAALPRPVRLHARVANTGYSPPQADAEGEEDNVYSLRGCASLHALDVEIEYTRAAACLRIMPPLKQVLLSCANLRVLRLDVRMPSRGCVMYAAPAEYCGLGFVAGERPPALEELTLEAYPFGERSEEEDRTEEDDDDDNDVDDSLVYEENTLGYPLPGCCETDFWATTFDWSRLRRLRTHLPSLALRMAPYLTALREVEFSSASDYTVEETRACQTGLNARETAHFGSTAICVSTLSHLGPPSSPFAHHGPTLQSLHIHQDETSSPSSSSSWRRSAISQASTLHTLGRSCPRLTSLSLDIARSGSGDWPTALLDALASARSFPRLRALALFFELGAADPEAPVRPYVTYAAVASGELLGRFRRRKQLQKLVVVSGAAVPEDLGFGLPAPTAFWPEYNSTAFECVASERDDEEEERKFAVRCTRLTEAQNEILRRVVEDGHGEEEDALRLLGGEEEKELPEAFKVALEGPTPVSEWDEHY
ncbi:hypothetical protein F5X96DRAFT_686988 [Biscogniauxia mediterranea]|nr:hypothetical protein F5X96DRAFT_686988 [Biscogniauxia mediterranea]